MTEIDLRQMAGIETTPNALNGSGTADDFVAARDQLRSMTEDALRAGWKDVIVQAQLSETERDMLVAIVKDRLPGARLRPLRDELRAAVNEIQRTENLLRDFPPDPPGTRYADEFVFDAVNDCFLDTMTMAEMSPRSLDKFTIHRRVPGQDVPEVHCSDWVTDPQNGNVIYGSVWRPGQPRIIVGAKIVDGVMMDAAETMKVMNRYIEPQRPEELPRVDAALAEKGIRLWKEHIEKLIPDERERLLVTQRLAFNVQHPGVKANGAVALCGGQGLGKDSIFTPMQRWLGNNFRVVRAIDLNSRWNDWMVGIITLANETSAEDRTGVEVYEAVKNALTTPPETIAIERKYARLTYESNVFCMWINTNHPYSFFVEEDDRRICFIQCVKYEKHEGFWDEYHQTINSGGWIGIIRFLNQYDLTGFNPKSDMPMTELKQKVLLSISSVKTDSELDDILDAAIFKFTQDNDGEPPRAILWAEIDKFIRESFEFDGDEKSLSNAVKKNKRKTHMLRERGYISAGKVKRPESCPAGRAMTGYVREEIARTEIQSAVQDRMKLFYKVKAVDNEVVVPLKPRMG